MSKYRVVTVVKPPFVMYDAVKKEWSGYCIDLLEYISKMSDFEYEIMATPDGKYGTMNDEGDWNGMIKELKDGRADIGLGALSVSSERNLAVDFTVPFYEMVGTTILMRKEEKETSLFQFLEVLDYNVWLCILGCYLVTTLFLWLFDRFSPFSYQNNPDKIYEDDDKRVFGLRESLWFTLTSITPQGGGEAPKNLSGRLTAATWWLFGFIVLASYTANLAAFLTVSRLEQPMESLDDLYHQYKYKFGVIRDSESHQYLQRMTHIEQRFYEVWKDLSLNDSLPELEQARLAVWDYPIDDKYTNILRVIEESKSGIVDSLKEAFDLVNGTKYALIGDGSDIKYIVYTHCEFTTVGEEFSKKPYALAIPKSSPLKTKLDMAITKMAEDGTLEKLKNAWWSYKIDRPRCPREYKISDGITIENIGGVFIILFSGIIVGVCTLIYEYWYFRCWLPQTHCRRTFKEKKEKRGKWVKKSKKVNVNQARRIAFEESGELKKKF
ncbi:ionotropic receptor 25a-like [Venturia canescens]|uniref:ionotropic receptor 25a-like n=1 Tax=Venturia canescens TaxID=32260 RepID=UPI001C9C22FA|nr:ionotropic receptor 25a-like [Venturia canescens]XP_043269226.1 ionotropic receptor 25a-like [Venturia canescens]